MYLTNQGVEAIVIPLYEEFGDECIDAVGDIVKGIELEPGDLEDCVMLTIKEAKEILQSSYDVLSWSMVGPTHRDNAVYVQNLLKYRIEQAETVK